MSGSFWRVVERQSAAKNATEPRSLEHANIYGLRPFRSLLRLKLDSLALLESLVAAHLNGAVMREQILAAIFWRNKPKPLVILKPLHYSGTHKVFSLKFLSLAV